MKQESSRREFTRTKRQSGVGTASGDWLHPKFETIDNFEAPSEIQISPSLQPRHNFFHYLRLTPINICFPGSQFVDFISNRVYPSTASARFIAGQWNILHINLAKEVKALWNLKVIPFVARALGGIPKGLKIKWKNWRSEEELTLSGSHDFCLEYLENSRRSEVNCCHADSNLKKKRCAKLSRIKITKVNFTIGFILRLFSFYCVHTEL